MFCDSVEFAESLGCIAYKIAAFEVRNLELIRAVSSTKKPIIISRGMISIQDLSEVVNILEKKVVNIFYFILSPLIQ